jgi:hypothetical protein
MMNWLGRAVSCEPVSGPNSLITGNFAGNLPIFASLHPFVPVVPTANVIRWQAQAVQAILLSNEGPFWTALAGGGGAAPIENDCCSRNAAGDRGSYGVEVYASGAKMPRPRSDRGHQSAAKTDALPVICIQQDTFGKELRAHWLARCCPIGSETVSVRSRVVNDGKSVPYG